MKDVKLTCLFVHFNSRSQIEPYVLTYLEQLSRIGFEILLISNSPVQTESRSSLNERVKSCKIFERENKGADFGGWKWAIDNNIIPEETDYLLLTNDSIYGPVFPLEPIFEAMNAKSHLDFWGLTDSYQGGWHIQSYFVFLSKKVFTSEAFGKVFSIDFTALEKKYIIEKGEIQLTRLLEDTGFKGEAYVPYPQLDPQFDDWDAKNPTHNFWEILITQFRFPFIKKELVIQNPENLQNVARVFSILKLNSGYPIADIQHSIADYLASFDRNNIIPSRICVICHLYYPGTIYYFLSRLFSLKSANTKFVFNLSAALSQNAFFLDMLLRYFPDAIVLHTPNQGRDIGGKLAAFDIALRSGIESDYTLIIHDKLSFHSGTGIEWRNKLLKIIDPKVLFTIFNEFERDPKIGVITSKELIKNEFDYDQNTFTCTSNDNLWNYIEKFNLNVVDYNFAAGTIFWIRTEILKNFFSAYPALSIRKDFEKGNALDFDKGTNIHAWERLFSFIAHSQGFKTSGI